MERAIKQIENFFNGYTSLNHGYAQALIKFVDEYSAFAEQHISLKIDEGKRNLDDTFAGVADVHRSINEENFKTSSLFNPLRFFVINENKMSEVIAFLLSPKEKHGQGDAYLRCFCNYFCPDEIVDFERVRIHCEKITDEQRRIDILVQVGDVYFIIENKFKGAMDQEDQLKHYHEYTHKQVKQRLRDNIFLFYLTPDGKEPSDVTLPIDVKKSLTDQNRLKVASFKKLSNSQKSVVGWLEQCLTSSQSQRMKDFIEDMIYYINEEDKMSKYKEEIFKWLLGNKDRTTYAHEIYSSWQDYRSFVLQELFKLLEQRLKEAVKKELGEGWSVSVSKDPSEKESGFILSKNSWNEKYKLYLYNSSGDFNDIYYGFGDFHKKTNEDEKRLREEMNERLQESPDKIYDEPGYAIWWSWSENLRNTTDIENFVKLLPDEREKTISGWIGEVIDLAKFLENDSSIKVESLVKKLK